MLHRFPRFLLLLSLAIVALAWQPAAPANAAPAAPLITSPAPGEQLATFSPVLTWANPGGAAQYHVQVVPFRDDGPGIDLYRAQVGNALAVPAAPNWYGLLPDMTYTWRVRVSDASGDIPLNDASWGPWAESSFRTPPATVDTLSLVSPAETDVVSTLNPTLQWSNTQAGIFYYELQLSTDPAFGTGFAGPVAAVSHLLVHGGVTRPFNSYTLPVYDYLKDDTVYYWRVRPRVQGDGRPTAWSTPAHFTTHARETPGLDVRPIAFGTQKDTASCGVLDPADTIPTTPTLTGVYYSYLYSGAGRVVHRWYAGEREVDMVSFDLKPDARCWDARFTLARDVPARPASYRLEVWYGGRLAQTGAVTIAPAPKLAVGPITVGTSYARRNCTVTDAATSFPASVGAVFFRWNTVGSGAYSAVLLRNGVPVVWDIGFTTEGPIGCAGFGRGIVPGVWELEVLIDNRTVQTVRFTVF